MLTKEQAINAVNRRFPEAVYISANETVTMYDRGKLPAYSFSVSIQPGFNAPCSMGSGRSFEEAIERLIYQAPHVIPLPPAEILAAFYSPAS